MSENSNEKLLLWTRETVTTAPCFEYKESFIPSNLVMEYYLTLLNELEWFHADGGRVPRKEYYVHAQELPYVYGTGQHSREYASMPDHPVIAAIREQLKMDLGFESDVVFLNLYEHHRHHLGWHADDSPEMSHDHPIVVVSFGAERELWVKANDADADRVFKFRLASGSAFIMKPGMQRTHMHRIPKSDRECGPRISLTFRKYVAPNG